MIGFFLVRDVRGGGGNVGEVIGFRAPLIARNLFRLLFCLRNRARHPSFLSHHHAPAAEATSSLQLPDFQENPFGEKILRRRKKRSFLRVGGDNTRARGKGCRRKMEQRQGF